MTTLDFQAPRRAGDVAAYHRFERPGEWIVLPGSMAIGERADGTPDFQIDLVRARDASLAGYGAIDLRVVPSVDVDEARRAIAAGDADTVRAGDFAGGWLRLLVREPGQADATLVVPPIAIASNGLGAIRLAAMLTADAASLLKQALLEGLILAEAWAEMRVEGVSPRIAADVTLDAASLRRVAPSGAGGGPIRRRDIVATLARAGVLSGVPAAADPIEVAEAVADRLGALAATLVPSPALDVTEWWRLDPAAATTRLRWDLREIVPVARVHVLRFDPVALVRAAVEADGLGRLVTTREVIDLRTGDVPVLVAANLPDVRSPVLACGVDLDAPPHPPQRPAAIRETIELVAPLDRQEVVLSFSASEVPEFGVQTSVVVQTDAGIHEWRSRRSVRAGHSVSLTPDDFGARFLPVTASPQLLNQGAVSVSAAWGEASQRVSLDGRATDTLVVPRDAIEVRCACRLTRDGRTLEATVPIDGGAIVLDLPLFRESGSHTVAIDVAFRGGLGPTLVAVEVKPESADDAAAVVLSFTAAEPARNWTWLAPSPFEPGYRYRLFKAGAPPRAWSVPQSPFEPLRLDADALVTPGQPA
jgi:hypothetical protein